MKLQIAAHVAHLGGGGVMAIRQVVDIQIFVLDPFFA
jgi:hypothetical protein